MCLEGTTEGWVGVDGTDGGGPLRPASFDGSGPSRGAVEVGVHSCRPKQTRQGQRGTMGIDGGKSDA